MRPIEARQDQAGARQKEQDASYAGAADFHWRSMVELAGGRQGAGSRVCTGEWRIGSPVACGIPALDMMT